MQVGAARGGTGGAALHGQNTAWRTHNLGWLLLSATDVFMREKLAIVHAAGFGQVTEVHMALVQNLDLHGSRLTELAARAGMTKPSMLELVDKVVRLGLVERRPDPDDQRAKMVMFTTAGLQMLTSLRQGVSQSDQRIATVMGADFVARMKERLTAYAAAVGGDQTAWTADSSWRTRNAGRALAAATRVFVRDVLRVVQENGFLTVTEADLRLFRHIGLDGTRQNEIGARAGTTKQAIAKLLEKAEALGFVTRRSDPGDGRAKIVTFTPAGLDFLKYVQMGTEEAERRAAYVAGKAFVDELRVHLGPYIVDAVGAAAPVAISA